MPRGPGTYGSKVGRPPKKIKEYGHGGGITVVLGGKPKPSYARGGPVMEDVEKADNYAQFSRMRPDVEITKEEFDRLKAGVPTIRAPDTPIRTRPSDLDVPIIRAPDTPIRTRPPGYVPPAGMKKGGKVSAYKKGGKVRVRKSKKRSFKGDGIARQGKTRGKIY